MFPMECTLLECDILRNFPPSAIVHKMGWTDLASGDVRLGVRMEFDGQALAEFSQPIAVIGRDGDLLSGNRLFSADAGLLSAEGDKLAPSLLSQLDRLIKEGRPARCPVSGPGSSGIFDLTALPLAGAPPSWLLLAFEVTLDVGLRDALIESRARYVDIVNISGDTAWETDQEGRFSALLPGGLAGHDPRHVIGQDAALLLDPARAAPAILPFKTPVAIARVDLWLRHADGRSVCVEVSAVPLQDRDGAWRGARGVCRDVTSDRLDRAALAQLRNVDRVLSHITEIFRRKIVPAEMLTAAAEATTRGLDADGCQILVAVQDPLDGTTRFDPVISSGQCPDPGLLTDQLRSLVDDGGRPRFEKTAAGLALLAPSFYAGSLIGAVILWRNPAGAAWNDVDLRLAATLAEHIAPVIEQRNDYNRLLDASRTDALTGLLNRRAFDEELLRRVQRLNRDRRRGALLYLDLDNFKAVNDRRGHAVGDEALRHVADILRGNTRGIDLVARLGGDEFAVWLENLSEVDAAKRAKVFLAAGASLVGYSGSPDQPLQVSIGVAPFDPDRAETVAALMKRADAAMYQVKHAGKGNYFVALLPEKE